jgi:predicted neutral ceramidase superfamily lipid hydrolase
MDRLMKTAGVVTLISKIMTIMAAVASVIGIGITGFYPGIIVLLFLPLIPILSNLYIKKSLAKSITLKREYYIAILIINLLTILVVLWMSFVILVDRVLGAIL